MIYSHPEEISLTVVPLDSTAISLQQQQKRKNGKLIRRTKRNIRIKANRSSVNSFSKTKQTYFPQQQTSLQRSKSFTRKGSHEMLNSFSRFL